MCDNNFCCPIYEYDDSCYPNGNCYPTPRLSVPMPITVPIFGPLHEKRSCKKKKTKSKGKQRSCMCQNNLVRTLSRASVCPPSGRSTQQHSYDPSEAPSNASTRRECPPTLLKRIFEQTEDGKICCNCNSCGCGEELDDKNLKLQESCADFLNIMQEAIVDTVELSINKTMREFFLNVLDKLECMGTQMLRNECLLSKMYLDTMDRLGSDQNNGEGRSEYAQQLMEELCNSINACNENLTAVRHSSALQDSRESIQRPFSDSARKNTEGTEGYSQTARRKSEAAHTPQDSNGFSKKPNLSANGTERHSTTRRSSAMQALLESRLTNESVRRHSAGIAENAQRATRKSAASQRPGTSSRTSRRPHSTRLTDGSVLQKEEDSSATDGETGGDLRKDSYGAELFAAIEPISVNPSITSATTPEIKRKSKLPMSLRKTEQMRYSRPQSVRICSPCCKPDVCSNQRARMRTDTYSEARTSAQQPISTDSYAPRSGRQPSTESKPICEGRMSCEHAGNTFDDTRQDLPLGSLPSRTYIIMSGQATGAFNDRSHSEEMNAAMPCRPSEKRASCATATNMVDVGMVSSTGRPSMAMSGQVDRTAGQSNSVAAPCRSSGNRFSCEKAANMFNDEMVVPPSGRSSGRPSMAISEQTNRSTIQNMNAAMPCRPSDNRASCENATGILNDGMLAPISRPSTGRPLMATSDRSARQSMNGTGSCRPSDNRVSCGNATNMFNDGMQVPPCRPSDNRASCENGTDIFDVGMLVPPSGPSLGRPSMAISGQVDKSARQSIRVATPCTSSDNRASCENPANSFSVAGQNMAPRCLSCLPLNSLVAHHPTGACENICGRQSLATAAQRQVSGAYTDRSAGQSMSIGAPYPPNVPNAYSTINSCPLDRQNGEIRKQQPHERCMSKFQAPAVKANVPIQPNVQGGSRRISDIQRLANQNPLNIEELRDCCSRFRIGKSLSHITISKSKM